MDTPTILRFFFALVLVLIMMGGLGLILKYVSNSRVIRGNGTKRLSVTETLSIALSKIASDSPRLIVSTSGNSGINASS